jgi:adenylyl cyclase-associated protein
VTSRLEDLYEHSDKGVPQPSNTSTPAPTAIAAAVPPPAPAQVQVTEDLPSVVAYDEQILKGKVQPFVKLTEKFTIASLVEQVSTYCLLSAMPDCASNPAL